jgi:hypothetical protein
MDQGAEPQDEDEGVVVLGRAVSEGEALPLGVSDPISAARAVRRALAAARRHAVDVDAIVVASTDASYDDALRRFARRALGPWGEEVPISIIRPDVPDADALARHAAREVTARMSHRIGIAVGLGSDGTTVALCVGPTGQSRVK